MQIYASFLTIENYENFYFLHLLKMYARIVEFQIFQTIPKNIKNHQKVYIIFIIKSTKNTNFCFYSLICYIKI